MNSKTKTLLILLSVTLNVAFIAGWSIRAVCAASGGTPSAGPATLQQQLDLTPSQWRQIGPLLEDYQKASSTIMHQVTQRRRELLDLLAASQPDLQRIQEKQREIQTGQRQCQDLTITHVLAEKQILTPAQQEKYFDLLRQYPMGPTHGGMGRWLQENQPNTSPISNPPQR